MHTRPLDLIPPGPHAKAVAAVLLALLPPLAAQASAVSYAGQFSNDDEIYTLSFSLTQATVWDVRTLSFAGGVNASGSGIDGGGFAPVLALFMQGAGLIQLNAGSSNSCNAGLPADPASGFCWDAVMHMILGAGDYTLVLSQDGNNPLGSELADGYSQAGQADYTGQWYLGMSDMRFIQVDGSQRIGSWAFDMQTSVIPEPPVLALVALALYAMTLRSRRPQPSHKEQQP